MIYNYCIFGEINTLRKITTVDNKLRLKIKINIATQAKNAAQEKLFS